MNFKYILSSFAQSCPTLCYPMDCSPSGSSIHRIFQARKLEWVAISYSRSSSWPKDLIDISGLLHWQTDSFTSVPLGKPQVYIIILLNITNVLYINPRSYSSCNCNVITFQEHLPIYTTLQPWYTFCFHYLTFLDYTCEIIQ